MEAMWMMIELISEYSFQFDLGFMRITPFVHFELPNRIYSSSQE